MIASDLNLLQQYAQHQAEDAFAEIVRRHLNLVYSAALRQVRSPQLAEEVAQSAFTDLARTAGKLKPDTIVTAWLYQVTRRTAVDVVRREVRRQMREQIATEMNTMNATTADWAHIEPLLEDAMHALDDTDRAAVLLRYFENKSLREVGATLGTSDDAAQKRVSRAVERLREFFAKRGITAGASGLAVVISANAVQAAPVGLAITISTAAGLAGTTIATTTTATSIKPIAMTTLQKTLITATIAAAVGTGIYESRRASLLANEVHTLQQQQAPLTEQIQQFQRNRDEAANRLSGLADQIERSKDISRELPKLRGEVARLRREIAEANQLSADFDRITNGPPLVRLEIDGSMTLFYPSTNDFARNVNAQVLVQKKARELEKLAAMRRKLNLSPEQAQNLRDLLMRSIEDETKPKSISSLEELAAWRNTASQLEAHIRALLSPEQQLAYEEFVQANLLANGRFVASRELLTIQSVLGLTQEQQSQVFNVLLQQKMTEEKQSADPLQPAQDHLSQRLKALETVLTPSEIQTYRESLEKQTFGK